MEMVGHQNVAVKFDGIDVDGLIEKLQKAASVCVIPIDVLLFIATAGDVIYSVRVLDAKGAGHEQKYGISIYNCQESRSDPISLLGNLIGASQRMVAHYEKAAQPPPSEKLHLLAKALHITADELLGIKPLKEEDKAANKKLVKTVKRLEKLSQAEQKAVIHYINALTPRKTATS
jgi:transcriptional regulator with XRE-family HTH domain